MSSSRHVDGVKRYRWILAEIAHFWVPYGRHRPADVQVLAIEWVLVLGNVGIVENCIDNIGALSRPPIGVVPTKYLFWNRKDTIQEVIAAYIPGVLIMR